MRHTQAAVLALVCASASAFQWPFKLPWLASNPTADQIVIDSNEPPVPHVSRIAVIGTGAAGSSAAYWLSLARTRNNLTFAIDVYERSDYIGGRSTIVYPFGDKSLNHIELGASIYVDVNYNLVRAAKEFGLTQTDSDYNFQHELGIWDGKEFVIRLPTNGVGYYRGQLKALLRYGMSSPTQVKRIVKGFLEHFVKLYDGDFGVFESVADAIRKLELVDPVTQSGAEYFDTESFGVKKLYSREVIEAATRVNYATNIDDISGFGALVSMSAEDAYSVAEGNWKIFEGFLNASDARVLLKTPVKKLAKVASGWELTSAIGEAMAYDAVILAAPLQSTGIKFAPALATKIPAVPYVHLHVTFVTTTSKHPSPEYFGTTPPPSILTTFNGAREGGPEPEFNSLNYIRPVKNGSDEWVVKLFSQKRLSDEWLEKVFGNVGWVHRHEWDAYPKLRPSALDAFASLNPDTGLYYVNAFEPFVSTMETETIASRNAVDMLLKRHFKASICPTTTPASERAADTPTNRSFIYGFDC